jgi:Flp pilus assembly pilin Flp
VLTNFPTMLAFVRARFGWLRTREEGVTAVEYALMVAIIAVLLVGAFYALFNTVKETYGEVGNCVASGPLPDTCSPPAAPPGT